MSVQATTWVWTQSRAQDNTLLVALAIADAANAQGAESCQSVKTIGRMTRASETTVHRAIKWLLEQGEIQYVGNNPRYGNTRVYQFPALWPGGPPVPALAPEGGANTGGADMAGGATSDTGGVPSEPERGAVGGTQPQRTPQGTNPPSPSDDGGGGIEVEGTNVRVVSTNDTSGLSTEDELFDDFWTHYPKKVSKKDAATAFAKALKSTDYATIRAGLVSAIKSWKADGKVTVERKDDDLIPKVVPGEPGKGVPHAATWLNGERWTDEYPKAEQASGNGEETPGWMTRRSD